VLLPHRPVIVLAMVSLVKGLWGSIGHRQVGFVTARTEERMKQRIGWFTGASFSGSRAAALQFLTLVLFSPVSSSLRICPRT
jgi:hypothetical protein